MQLKALGVRLMLVGVPNKKGRPPATRYFAGIIDPALRPSGGGAARAKMQCVQPQRTLKPDCIKLNNKLFPIVTEPVSENLFATDSWNVQDLLDGSFVRFSAIVSLMAIGGAI